MHDHHPIRSVLALLLPVALLLTAGCVLAGETALDAVFAIMKVTVIR